jgi:succinate dehydrogenase / fumarate reductase, cytochrome b subunit
MYRGGIGMWSWILHRVTGVGILLFLIIHVLDTALVLWGPEAYNHVMSVYQSHWFRPMEVFLLATVLFHALNGLRVIAVDLFSWGSKYQQHLFWLVMLVFWPAFLYGSYRMLLPLWL